MTIKVLPIRFGFALSEDPPKRHATFYRRLAGVYFDDEVAAGDVLVGKTIPIAQERSVSWQTVVECIVAGLGDSEASGILLDLGGPEERDVSRPDVLMGATSAIDFIHQKRSKTEIAVLLPRPLNVHDLASPAFLRLAKSDSSVRILSCDGEAYGQYFEARPPTASQVAAWSEEARTDPLDSLKDKLIRRIGQYRLPDASSIIRQLYDGSMAFDEIYELARLRIDQHSESAGRIAYDVRHSAWFRGPVEAALRDLGRQNRSVSIANIADYDPHKDVGLLMVAVVRTGASLGRLLGAAKDMADVPDVWSLLSTDGPDARNGKRSLKLEHAGSGKPRVSVGYALRVAGGEAAPDQRFWQESGLEPIDTESARDNGKLSSDAMWGMIFEAGLELEEPVPPHRRSIGYVPRFGRIASLNGPFIAAKFDALLKDRFASSLPPSIGFLCPAEPNAKDLANSLRALAGHDTILVERSLINAFAESTTTSGSDQEEALAKVKGPLEAWGRLAAQASLTERPRIVLLDEFDLSGRTFDGLQALADKFGLPVLCAVSLASYGLTRKQRNSTVPRLSLYDMGRAHGTH